LTGLPNLLLVVKLPLGFVAISAKENAQLQETTDREGFTNTAYYVNFKEMLDHFVRFSETGQEFLRRSWTEFRKAHVSPAMPTQAVVSTEQLSAQLKEGLSQVAESLGLADQIKGAVTQAAEAAQRKVSSVARSLPEDSPAYRHVQTAIRELQATMDEAKNVSRTIDQHAAKIRQLQSVGEQVNVRLESLKEQLAQVYEIVSLGLTAEALSHEIHNISDGLAERTQKLKKHLAAKMITDPTIVAFVEHVATSVAALRKQLAHLTPSLRYVRHKREPILMSEFAKETADYHHSRLQGANIEFDVTLGRTGDFTVSMNKGKLTQVFDNLCLNSEYWIREEMRLKRLERGVISVKVAKPFMRIHDNGRGVDPSVEASLFQPFVTAKGRGKGRGLGLFIVRQLLDSDGCTISVLPTRNAHDRLYIFQIDFTGALNGSS
jgi:C4-dicarboxylate-specific signal transduction histidine kinase